MKADKHSISLILEGKTQFILPVYQRHYSWGKEQWAQLWNDIVSMQKSNKKSHFIGSIVNIAAEVAPAGTKKFTLIDGQQRMATLTLMAIVLRDYARDNPDATNISPEEIEDELLWNKHAKNPDDKYKLVLTENDRDMLITLIESKPMTNDSSKLLEAYVYFNDKLTSEHKELTPDELHEAIEKLQIVNITLDEDDDAQAIFESLNSTGRDLSQSDLIRNYVLMGFKLDEQSYAYDNLWRPMELLFAEDVQRTDDFFRDYLTAKRSRIPNKDRVYEDFKEYRNNGDFESMKDLCQDIYKHAKFYTDMIFARSDNAKLNRVYQDIRDLKVVVYYPFILKAHSDYDEGIINLDELIEVMKLCVSYMLRLKIYEAETHGTNRTFAILRGRLDVNNYVSSLKKFLLNTKGGLEFPDDEKFARAFLTRDVYHMTIKEYILSSLENHDKKVPIDIKNYQIEHIMPQNPNLSEAWRDELGLYWRDIQKQYLHTIGNLTLTAYNSELGDKPFLQKVNMSGGYKESALKLNATLVKLTHWNAEEIIKRAKTLAQEAIEIWEYPEIFEGAGDSQDIYTLEHYDFSNVTRELFDALNDRIMALSPQITREFKKFYISYKLKGNLVDVNIQKYKLRMWVNMNFRDVIDPEKRCRDVSKVGHWGVGDVDIVVSNAQDIDYVMKIITQAM